MSTQRTVLITGASGGVGRALTRALDQEGWRVFAGVRSPQAAATIEAGGGNVTAVELEITEADSPAARPKPSPSTSAIMA